MASTQAVVVPPDPTGLLVIRAWREQGSQVPLRAEIRLTHDVSMGFERKVTLTDVIAVSEFVRQWLEVVLQHSEL